jgi:uncharacterized membrane-anchored protein YhcB (DUF1043 family)
MVRWFIQRGLLITGILVGMVILVMSVTWATFQIRRNTAELEINRLRMEQAITDRKATDAEMRKELDEIYRTLYAELAELDTPSRRRSVVETWSVTRDKELRARIESLERWRFGQMR